MEYLARYNIYFGIIICSVVAISVFHIVFVGMPDLMVKDRCIDTKRGFKTKSIYFYLPLYYFCIISAIMETVAIILMKGAKHYYSAVIWTKCIGIVVSLLAGYIWAHYKGVMCEVKGEYLYISEREKLTISIPELKRCAQKNVPQYENGKVRFKYMDDFLIIPVKKCIGGYDFVNMLCDKMELPRIYMEDIRL